MFVICKVVYGLICFLALAVGLLVIWLVWGSTCLA